MPAVDNGPDQSDRTARTSGARGRRPLIEVAMGRGPADLVVRGGRLVNVATSEIYPADIAIKGERIAAVGEVGYTIGDETQVVDAGGRYLVPGLVDGHLHMYHSYLGVPEFVEAMLKHGVTASADAFYGQGIVGGMDAIRWFKDTFDRMPLRVLFLVPTLAYLQNRELGLTPTEGVGVQEMFEMLDWPGCYGLEEPPFLPVVDAWPEFLDLFEATLERRKVITGHASGIDDRQTQAYVAMGCYTDHETVDVDDALRKARAGMKLLMRQGSGCTDVPQLVRAFTEHGIDPRALAFSVDVASPEKLTADGGIDENIRVAIAHGVPPVTAIQMGTINVAEIFYAQQDVGLIAPGRFADILLVDDLVDFSIQRVLVGGQVIVENGELVGPLPTVRYPASFRGTVLLPHELAGDDFQVRVDDDRTEAEVRVIGVTEGSLVSEERRHRLPVRHGVVEPSVPDDILQLAMVDRHGKGTGVGVGFVQGFSQLEFCFACGEIGDIKLSEEGLVQVHPPTRLDVVVA